MIELNQAYRIKLKLKPSIPFLFYGFKKNYRRSSGTGVGVLLEGHVSIRAVGQHLFVDIESLVIYTERWIKKLNVQK